MIQADTESRVDLMILSFLAVVDSPRITDSLSVKQKTPHFSWFNPEDLKMFRKYAQGATSFIRPNKGLEPEIKIILARICGRLLLRARNPWTMHVVRVNTLQLYGRYKGLVKKLHYVNVSVLIKFSQNTSIFTVIIISSPYNHMFWMCIRISPRR